MVKADASKKEKKERILKTAFDLFLSKGIDKTTVKNITEEAGMAKGTFYLYFKDKNQIIEEITVKKFHEVVHDAVCSAEKKKYDKIQDKIVFVVEYIIDIMSLDVGLLKFLYKNLTYDVYERAVYDPFDEKQGSIIQLFASDMELLGADYKKSVINFFLILDLASSAGYNSILFEKPFPINEYKPYLLEAVRKLMG